jgi:hypothetical protein
MTKILLHPGSTHEGRSFVMPKQQKGKKKGRRPRASKEPPAHSLAEQPIAEMSTTVPCKVCGYAVDPKRLHAHMVRFHGVAFRTARPDVT